MSNNKIRTQSILGNTSRVQRKDLQMNGFMCLGIVLKIHHKRNTADVRLIRGNDVIMSSEENEGKFACKINTSTAHFDPEINKSSGVIEPLHEGQLVIIGYLDNFKSEPFILSSLHITTNPKHNILPSKYPIDSYDTSYTFDKREFNKYLRVFPSQDYFRFDGEGNMEFSMHGKSFLKIDDALTDLHNALDFEDLSEKDKFTNKTLTLEDESSKHPKDFLFVQRDNWNDELTKWTKFFLNGEGLFRISRDNDDDKLTFMEHHNDGMVRIKRQQDSNLFDESEEFTEFSIDDMGKFEIIQKKSSNEEDIHTESTSSIVIPESTSIISSKKLSTSYPNDMNEILKTSSEITSDGNLNLERSYSCSYPNNSSIDIENSVVINDDITISKNFSFCSSKGSTSFSSASISIDSSNNISIVIGSEEGSMVDASFGANGTVDIFGRNGVTIRSKGKSFSV